MYIYNVTKEFWFTANLTEHWPPEDSEHWHVSEWQLLPIINTCMKYARWTMKSLHQKLIKFQVGGFI